MKSVMKHSFAETPTITAPRSRFDMPFSHKFTADAGWLIPFFWSPVLPGDTFNVQTSIFARLATPIFPLMDNAFIDIHWFYTPNRILWDNWQKFCGEQTDPGDSIDFQIPVIEGATASDPVGDLTTVAGRVGQLMDLIGCPDGLVPDNLIANNDGISALPFRCYSRVYSEWFRDQNLIDSTNLITDDGPDDMDSAVEQVMLMRRNKRHDYFTSALPFPQKGDAVTIPLGTTAPVLGIGDVAGFSAYPLGPATARESNASTAVYASADTIDGTGANMYVEEDPLNAGFPNIRADLTNATAATINDLREAFQIQKLLERDSRAGTRYHELIQNHFGVTIPYPAYRPEYLGGGSMPLNINPVASTAQTSVTIGNQRVGDLAAFGTASDTNAGFNKSFVEHGIVMGFCSIRADLTYSQGINRHLSHSTRYDIFWPSLAFLGEQAILNKEIYYQNTAADDEVFGYIPRYDEYRYKPSQISGLFKPTAASNIAAWHLSQEFASLPTLGQTFIEEDPPFDRVIQFPDEPHFIVDSFTMVRAARPMPVHAVPGMIDHF